MSSGIKRNGEAAGITSEGQPSPKRQKTGTQEKTEKVFQESQDALTTFRKSLELSMSASEVQDYETSVSHLKEAYKLFIEKDLYKSLSKEELIKIAKLLFLKTKQEFITEVFVRLFYHRPNDLISLIHEVKAIHEEPLMQVLNSLVLHLVKDANENDIRKVIIFIDELKILIVKFQLSYKLARYFQSIDQDVLACRFYINACHTGIKDASLKNCLLHFYKFLNVDTPYITDAEKCNRMEQVVFDKFTLTSILQLRAHKYLCNEVNLKQDPDPKKWMNPEKLAVEKALKMFEFSLNFPEKEKLPFFQLPYILMLLYSGNTELALEYICNIQDVYPLSKNLQMCAYLQLEKLGKFPASEAVNSLKNHLKKTYPDEVFDETQLNKLAEFHYNFYCHGKLSDFEDVFKSCKSSQLKFDLHHMAALYFTNNKKWNQVIHHCRMAYSLKVGYQDIALFMQTELFMCYERALAKTKGIYSIADKQVNPSLAVSTLKVPQEKDSLYEIWEAEMTVIRNEESDIDLQKGIIRLGYIVWKSLFTSPRKTLFTSPPKQTNSLSLI